MSGNAANLAIISYFREAGRAEMVSDEVAWCAAFAMRCLKLSGIHISAVPRSQRLLANSLLKIGTSIDEPRIGAVCVLSHGSDPRMRARVLELRTAQPFPAAIVAEAVGMSGKDYLAAERGEMRFFEKLYLLVKTLGVDVQEILSRISFVAQPMKSMKRGVTWPRGNSLCPQL